MTDRLVTDLDGFDEFVNDLNSYEANEMPELDTVPPSNPPDIRAMTRGAVITLRAIRNTTALRMAIGEIREAIDEVRAAIIEAIMNWFFENFENPAHETPWDGGYVYIWGGPYYTEDEIRDAFEGKIGERTIREAIEQIEQEGSEWAPASSRIQPIRSKQAKE